MNQSASHSKKQAVLSLSGGLDSSTLLLHLLANDYEVTALSFDYGQKHKVELERATDLVQYINQNLDNWNSKENPYPKVTHQIIKLDGLAQLLNSSLVEGGSEVPEGHYAAENMKDTVVPNRNKIFSSIIQAVALSIADKKGTECSIAMGIHAGDHAIYPDCRQDFRDADFDAFIIGNWGAENVNVYTPYMDTDKFGILKDGMDCLGKLNLDFNEVYYRTNTSYKPIYIEYPMGSTMEDMRNGPEGVWYSDYKSASSVERIEAFMKLGRPDPVLYADLENGPVTWETVVKHVEEVLEKHNS
jgi:7-cyano-7-deazaguanine synthase